METFAYIFAYITLTIAAVAGAQFMGRPIFHYLKCLCDGRLMDIKNLKRKFGSNIQIYIIKDFWIYSAIAWPRDFKEPPVLTSYILDRGILINRFYIKKGALHKAFPEVLIEEVMMKSL